MRFDALVTRDMVEAKHLCDVAKDSDAQFAAGVRLISEYINMIFQDMSEEIWKAYDNKQVRMVKLNKVVKAKVLYSSF